MTSILLKYNPISQNILSPETQTTRHHIVRFYPCLLDFIIRFYVAMRASLLAVSMLLLGAFHALAKRRSRACCATFSQLPACQRARLGLAGPSIRLCQLSCTAQIHFSTSPGSCSRDIGSCGPQRESGLHRAAGSSAAPHNPPQPHKQQHQTGSRMPAWKTRSRLL